MSGLKVAGLLGIALAGIASASPLSPDKRQSSTYANPILWEDLPDLDVFRVGDVYYYSSSTFAYSPGAPILKSYDLANWTPVSHSVPSLDFGSTKYNLASSSDRAYVKGIWASTMRYRESTDTFYWIGCIEFSKTYIYTASGTNARNNNGEVDSWDWKQAAVLDTCYYDCGLLIDDDDTMYVAYGSTNSNGLSVAQLSSDGLSQVTTKQVFTSDTYFEGSHMYKINGYYWIIPTKVATGEWALRSKNPFGPYEDKIFFDQVKGPLSNAGNAHQGGMVEAADGKWHYIAFLDSYPGGRIPVMAPITWDAEGWPQITLNGTGAWGLSYDMPVSTSKTVPGPTGKDSFTGSALSAQWEWNHNPDTSKFSLAGGDGGLILKTATVTDDLFTARNTLTHRILGPKSEAVFEFDISKMADGDRAGAALFRDWSAYIGVHKEGNTATLVYVNDVTLNDDWTTKSKGTVAATGPTLTASTVYLRIVADITPALNLNPVREGVFSYSLDGQNWTQLGGSFLLRNSYTFFMGYRFAAFNFATKALGGQATLRSFSMELAS
ncbi:hypothetical protein JX265_007468 [Neoarthrinium moseri]|uniref:Beta-xylosidase C-terminal Concanavalin A-like domain-containing protein n=1 Tax=Neoarthrinium moseri TaxID=1658444 RepID=A0A9Q0ANF0_9PEZI|nr:hypothetical protein JX265_007468 [Neoarthrinium moseri]